MAADPHHQQQQHSRSNRRRRGTDSQREIWTGDFSSVIGLQKRGLRGLMEGRRLRERSSKPGSTSGPISVPGESYVPGG